MNRLIFPVRGTIARVDPTATAVSPGYDPDFAELRLVDGDGDGVADAARAELPPVELLCQVEPASERKSTSRSPARSPSAPVVRL